MFDVGWSELGVIALLAVIILGPKELPRAMRTAGQWMRKLRLLASDFQKHLDDMVEEAELADLRDQAKKLSSTDIKQELTKAVDPDGNVARDLSATEQEIRDGVKSAGDAAQEAKASLSSSTSPTVENAPEGADPASGETVPDSSGTDVSETEEASSSTPATSPDEAVTAEPVQPLSSPTTDPKSPVGSQG